MPFLPGKWKVGQIGIFRPDMLGQTIQHPLLVNFESRIRPRPSLLVFSVLTGPGTGNLVTLPVVTSVLVRLNGFGQTRKLGQTAAPFLIQQISSGNATARGLSENSIFALVDHF
jgi:hypothetical protein